MQDRRRNRDNHHVLDAVNAWAGVGPLFRLIVAVVAIMAIGWGLMQIIGLAHTLALVLSR